MVDLSDATRTNSEEFQYKLDDTEFHIKKATKSFLVDNEDFILCMETVDGDVVRVLLAQLMRTLKKEQVLKPNYDVLFTDFSDFTKMSLNQNEEWANNFPDLLVCKLNEMEKLEEHFYILKSWENVVQDKSKKIMFIVEDSKHLKRIMMKIGMANIFKLKLAKLWKEGEATKKDEAICKVEKNVFNNESTSSRALDEESNVNNVIEEEHGKASLHDEATADDNADLVKLLQSLGVEELDAINKDGNTQLHLAARDGKTQIVESLLAQGAKKDIKNNYFDETALHLAVEMGHSAIVQMLLEYGFNVNATNNYFQYTPLNYACAFHNDAHLIEILLKFGAGIERKDRIGQTALHLASSNGRSAVVNSLLKHGAKINAQDDYGNSPLHYATIWDRQEVVPILLELGADLSIKNKEQQNVLDVARSSNFTKLIQILENHKGCHNKINSVKV